MGNKNSKKTADESCHDKTSSSGLIYTYKFSTDRRTREDAGDEKGIVKGRPEDHLVIRSIGLNVPDESRLLFKALVTTKEQSIKRKFAQFAEMRSKADDARRDLKSRWFIDFKAVNEPRIKFAFEDDPDPIRVAAAIIAADKGDTKLGPEKKTLVPRRVVMLQLPRVSFQEPENQFGFLEMNDLDKNVDGDRSLLSPPNLFEFCLWLYAKTDDAKKIMIANYAQKAKLVSDLKSANQKQEQDDIQAQLAKLEVTIAEDRYFVHIAQTTAHSIVKALESTKSRIENAWHELLFTLFKDCRLDSALDMYIGVEANQGDAHICNDLLQMYIYAYENWPVIQVAEENDESDEQIIAKGLQRQEVLDRLFIKIDQRGFAILIDPVKITTNAFSPVDFYLYNGDARIEDCDGFFGVATIAAIKAMPTEHKRRDTEGRVFGRLLAVEQHILSNPGTSFTAEIGEISAQDLGKAVVATDPKWKAIVGSKEFSGLKREEDFGVFVKSFLDFMDSTKAPPSTFPFEVKQGKKTVAVDIPKAALTNKTKDEIAKMTGKPVENKKKRKDAPGEEETKEPPKSKSVAMDETDDTQKAVDTVAKPSASKKLKVAKDTGDKKKTPETATKPPASPAKAGGAERKATDFFPAEVVPQRKAIDFGDDSKYPEIIRITLDFIRTQRKMLETGYVPKTTIKVPTQQEPVFVDLQTKSVIVDTKQGTQTTPVATFDINQDHPDYKGFARPRDLETFAATTRQTLDRAEASVKLCYKNYMTRLAHRQRFAQRAQYISNLQIAAAMIIFNSAKSKSDREDSDLTISSEIDMTGTSNGVGMHDDILKSNKPLLDEIHRLYRDALDFKFAKIPQYGKPLPMVYLAMIPILCHATNTTQDIGALYKMYERQFDGIDKDEAPEIEFASEIKVILSQFRDPHASKTATKNDLNSYNNTLVHARSIVVGAQPEPEMKKPKTINIKSVSDRPFNASKRNLFMMAALVKFWRQISVPESERAMTLLIGESVVKNLIDERKYAKAVTWPQRFGDDKHQTAFISWLKKCLALPQFVETALGSEGGESETARVALKKKLVVLETVWKTARYEDASTPKELIMFDLDEASKLLATLHAFASLSHKLPSFSVAENVAAFRAKRDLENFLKAAKSKEAGTSISWPYLMVSNLLNQSLVHTLCRYFSMLLRSYHFGLADPAFYADMRDEFAMITDRLHIDYGSAETMDLNRENDEKKQDSSLFSIEQSILDDLIDNATKKLDDADDDAYDALEELKWNVLDLAHTETIAKYINNCYLTSKIPVYDDSAAKKILATTKLKLEIDKDTNSLVQSIVRYYQTPDTTTSSLDIGQDPLMQETDHSFKTFVKLCVFKISKSGKTASIWLLPSEFRILNGIFEIALVGKQPSSSLDKSNLVRLRELIAKIRELLDGVSEKTIKNRQLEYTIVGGLVLASDRVRYESNIRLAETNQSFAIAGDGSEPHLLHEQEMLSSLLLGLQLQSGTMQNPIATPFIVETGSAIKSISEADAFCQSHAEPYRDHDVYDNDLQIFERLVRPEYSCTLGGLVTTRSRQTVPGNLIDNPEIVQEIARRTRANGFMMEMFEDVDIAYVAKPLLLDKNQKPRVPDNLFVDHLRAGFLANAWGEFVPEHGDGKKIDYWAVLMDIFQKANEDYPESKELTKVLRLGLFRDSAEVSYAWTEILAAKLELAKTKAKDLATKGAKSKDKARASIQAMDLDSDETKSPALDLANAEILKLAKMHAKSESMYKDYKKRIKGFKQSTTTVTISPKTVFDNPLASADSLKTLFLISAYRDLVSYSNDSLDTTVQTKESGKSKSKLDELETDETRAKTYHACGLAIQTSHMPKVRGEDTKELELRPTPLNYFLPSGFYAGYKNEFQIQPQRIIEEFANHLVDRFEYSRVAELKSRETGDADTDNKSAVLRFLEYAILLEENITDMAQTMLRNHSQLSLSTLEKFRSDAKDSERAIAGLEVDAKAEIKDVKDEAGVIPASMNRDAWETAWRLSCIMETIRRMLAILSDIRSTLLFADHSKLTEQLFSESKMDTSDDSKLLDTDAAVKIRNKHIAQTYLQSSTALAEAVLSNAGIETKAVVSNTGIKITSDLDLLFIARSGVFSDSLLGPDKTKITANTSELYLRFRKLCQAFDQMIMAEWDKAKALTDESGNPLSDNEARRELHALLTRQDRSLFLTRQLIISTSVLLSTNITLQADMFKLAISNADSKDGSNGLYRRTLKVVRRSMLLRSVELENIRKLVYAHPQSRIEFADPARLIEELVAGEVISNFVIYRNKNGETTTLKTPGGFEPLKTQRQSLIEREQKQAKDKAGRDKRAQNKTTDTVSKKSKKTITGPAKYEYAPDQDAIAGVIETKNKSEVTELGFFVSDLSYLCSADVIRMVVGIMTSTFKAQVIGEKQVSELKTIVDARSDFLYKARKAEKKAKDKAVAEFEAKLERKSDAKRKEAAVASKQTFDDDDSDDNDEDNDNKQFSVPKVKRLLKTPKTSPKPRSGLGLQPDDDGDDKDDGDYNPEDENNNSEDENAKQQKAKSKSEKKDNTADEEELGSESESEEDEEDEEDDLGGFVEN